MFGAEVNLKLPPKLQLDGHLCENWNRFKTHLKIYLATSGNDIDLADKSEEEKRLINKYKAKILLNTAGEEAIALISTLGLAGEELDDYDLLVAAFDNYFIESENYVFSRYQFNNCVQQEGQTFDQFLSEARRLIEKCGYGLQQNSILRDRILMGVHDKKLKHSLLKFKVLSLDHIIQLCRHAEEVQCVEETSCCSVGIKEEYQKDQQSTETNFKCPSCYLQFSSLADLSQHKAACDAIRMSTGEIFENGGGLSAINELNGSNECWGPCIGAQPSFHYTGCEKIYLFGERCMMKPTDMYQVFLTDEIIDYMVEEINVNAANTLNSRRKDSDLLNIWKPTNREELKIYVGLRIWMGLVRMSRFVDYWSEYPVFQNGVAKKAMTKNRFQIIFKFWHMRIGTEQGNPHLIHPILEKLEQRFMEVKSAGEFLVLNENTPPPHTDRIFSQYMPFKREQSTKKEFRLCDPSGYTYRMVAVAGKGLVEPNNPRLATHFIMNMVEPYLDYGRTLCFDSYSTSMELIQSLLERRTHFLGTLDKNNPDFPEEVMNAPVRKGQGVAMENKVNGMTVMKWGDDGDVQIVSTKYSTSFASIGRTSRTEEAAAKPTIVLEYEKIKGALDTGDLLSSYTCFHAKNVQWPHRVVDDTVFFTCLVNALIIWNETRPAGARRMSLLQFSREICQQFLNMPEDLFERTTNPTTHYLGQAQEVEGNKTQRKARGRCRGCYKDLLRSMSRKEAMNKVKRVSTRCITCPDKPYLCLQCFKDIHEGFLS